MTVNSIGYITKKHFRCGLSVIKALIAVAISAVSCYLAVMKGLDPGLAVFAGFASLSALFTVISLFSAGTGCTLMRMSIAVNAVVSFFSAMAMFTLGYLLIRNEGTQDTVNEILSGLGLNTITTQPIVTGELLFAGSTMLYFASGCAFFGHRYLGAARTCASGTLKRSGFRVFPLLSFILFVFASGAAAGLVVILCPFFIDKVLSDRFSQAEALLISLLLLHLLISGICARSFARKSFAFKVFENRMMTVQTNADGTVYVPVNEDKEPNAEEPLLPTKKHEEDDSHHGAKQFIKEYARESDEFAEGNSQGEGYIL